MLYSVFHYQKSVSRKISKFFVLDISAEIPGLLQLQYYTF